MRILAIIPARGGSKGVPGKNIKLLEIDFQPFFKPFQSSKL
jgi:CMP-N-acetylneuraminic acid synthetase